MAFLAVLLVLGLTAWLVLKWHEAQETLRRLEARLNAMEVRFARMTERTAPSPASPASAPDSTPEADPSNLSTGTTDPASTAPSPALPPPLPQGPQPAGSWPSSVLPDSPIVPRPWDDASLRAAETASDVPESPSSGEPTPAPSLAASLQSLLNAPKSEQPGRPSGAASGAASPPAVAKPEPAFQWESFLGVKLFAWLGGLALFLGVAFFVKYSFDHDLISPAMRVAIGYVVGLGLIAGAGFIPRARHIVTVQSLMATGIVVLYADTFAAQAHYDFFGFLPTFGLMSAITVLAFVLAVRLDAQVVAILGWLGGFLTPWLLSQNRDNPAGLFGYLALLDLGLIAVVVRQRWNYLALLGAVATAVMQFGWAATFYSDSKIWIAMGVFVGFAALFLAAFWLAHRMDRVDRWTTTAAIVPPAAGWLFAAYLLSRPEIASRVWLILGFICVLDLVFLGLAWRRTELRIVLSAAGGVVFALMMGWTARYLTPERLNAALVFYFLFAVLHALIPFALEWRQLKTLIGSAASSASAPPAASHASIGSGLIHVFPSLALILILVPLFTMAGPSVWIWPVVLFVDLLAIALAVLTASLGSLLAVLLLTALGTAAWIFQLPAELPGVTGMLTVVGGFSLFFTGAALLAGRQLGDASSPGGVGRMTVERFGQIASLAAALPFLLLTMVVARLPLANPSLVFGLGWILAAMLLGVAHRSRQDILGLVTLGSAAMLEFVWHLNHFAPANFGLAVMWSAAFGALFFVFPFCFRASLGSRLLPWVTAALSWPVQFLLVYWAVTSAHPGFAYPGLIPALLALPCLAGLAWLVRREPGAAPDSGVLGRRALLGGAALLFITLVVPIQFDRHWVTLGWAFEGVALLGLFHRVPHPGLRLTGVGLLLAAFVRLALNPWILLAYERTGTPLWNWYLYSYGLVGVSLLVAGRLLAPPRNQVLQTNMPPVLYSLGTVILFLLVNIEIADFFSLPGGRLVFEFSGSFAQDMAYTLAWALFASILMAVGFRKQQAGTRYAGLGLLVLTLMKLFLHDLWRLGGLHRIGSLVGLAVVLILVSFVYQRFLSDESSARKTRGE